MRRLAWLLLLCLAAAAQAAPARSPARASALAKDAEKAYAENRYRDAAQLLQQAWAEDPAPVYLYNIARALDQAGDLEGALDAYRQYVALPSTKSQGELVKKANLAMDRLRTLVAKAEAERTMQEAEKKRLAEEAKQAKARADAEAAEARRQREAFEAKEAARVAGETRQADGRRLGTWVAGGVAVAALGTSLGFAIAAGANRAAFRQASTLEQKSALEAATRTTAAVTDVALVVGVTAAVTAVVLFPRAGNDAAPVSVAVAPVAGGAVASIGGAF